jgi:hypothetical protein
MQKFKKPLNNLEFNCGLIETLGNLRTWYRKNESPEFWSVNSSKVTLKCFNWEDCSFQIQFSESRTDFFDYEKLTELELLEDYVQEFYSLSENYE